MKRLNKFLAILITITFFSTLIPINSVDAATATISGNKTIEVGQTVTISASTTAGAWNLQLSGNGTSKGLVGQTTEQGNKTASTSITFKPTASGTYTFYLTGDITDYNTDATTYFTKGNNAPKCTITVTEPKPVEPTPSNGDNGSNNNNNNNSNNNNNNSNNSNNNSNNSNNNNNNQNNNNNNNQNNNNNDNKPKNTTKPEENAVKSDNYFLASLSVNQGKLSPEFEKGTKNYDIVFDEGFDFSTLNKIEISAKAEDSKATVTLPSDTSVRDGENTYLVTVNAEDSTSITYTLKLKKPEKLIDSGLRLKTLSIDGVNKNGENASLSFTPEFNPEIKEYRANIDENIDKIKVNAEAEENVTIEVQGGENLSDGENNIYIYLKSKTEDTNSTEESPVTVYKIIVDKKAKASEGKKKITMSKTVLLIVLGIVGILVLLLVCLIIVNKKIKKANEDYEEFIEEEKTEKIDEESENIEDTEKGDKTEDKAEETDDETQDKKEKNGKRFK